LSVIQNKNPVEVFRHIAFGATEPDLPAYLLYGKNCIF